MGKKLFLFLFIMILLSSFASAKISYVDSFNRSNSATLGIATNGIAWSPDTTPFAISSNKMSGTPAGTYNEILGLNGSQEINATNGLNQNFSFKYTTGGNSNQLQFQNVGGQYLFSIAAVSGNLVFLGNAGWVILQANSPGTEYTFYIAIADDLKSATIFIDGVNRGTHTTNWAAISPVEVVKLQAYMYTAGVSVKFDEMYIEDNSSVPSTQDPVFVSPTPANNTANNTQVTINWTCADGNNYLWFNETKVIDNSSESNYTTSISSSGIFEYTASCYNVSISGFSNNVTRFWTYDIVDPGVVTTFVNNSFVFLENLTAQFNFSDNFYLNSFNITIDGVEIASNESLSGNFTSVNISTNISSLTAGLHNLSVVLADAHTAQVIPDYEISTGLLGDRLEYGWVDKHGISKSVKIKNNGGSIFDSFSTTKKIDRYTWYFEPLDKKSSYVFDIEADDKIRIIEDDSTYLKSWITFGNKWMDFDLYGENSSVEITRINDKKIKVKISNIKNPDKQKYQSIGDMNIIEVNYSFYKLNASVSYQTAVFEGSYSTSLLNLETDDLLLLNNSANLIWDNVSQNVSRINISDDIVEYNLTFLVPFVNSSAANWTWFFNVSGYEFNISGSSEFIQMNITNCSAGDYIVLNYTIYDEETQIAPVGSNASIENFLTITTPDFDGSVFEFTIKQPTNNLLICLPNSTLNYSTWILDSLTKYSYDSHVEEFHYIENFELNNSVIPKVISLYDLASADSTSFLVTYQDESYLYVDGVIIDLLRQYTYLNGEFFSVEHARTDSGGQSRLHFVTEDVIYKANVWDDGELVYTTGEFSALCQATPCQINLRKPYDNPEGVSEVENIVYDISTQDEFYTSKNIVFEFSTKDGTSTTILMNVTQTTSLFNDTICSSTKVLSAGTIVCTIPLAYYNSTYTARIWKDGNFIGWRTYNMKPSADDIFGRTGVFLGALGFLMLGFMGISSGIAIVILAIIGFIAMSMMNLLIGGSIFGVGSTIIWLIIAGAILVWKYTQRRVQ